MRVKLARGGVVLDGAEVLRDLADRMAPAHRDTLLAIAGTTDVELAIPVRVTVANMSVAIGSAAYRDAEDGAAEALTKIGKVIDRHTAVGGPVGTPAGEIREVITEWRESQP